MSERISLRMSQEDFLRAQRFKVRNPVLYVLQRTTGTLWRLYEDGLLLEVMEPFRTCQLSPTLMENYREFLVTGEMAPFECDLELKGTSLQHDYATGGKQPSTARLREALSAS